MTTRAFGENPQIELKNTRLQKVLSMEKKPWYNARSWQRSLELTIMTLVNQSSALARRSEKAIFDNDNAIL